MYMLDTNILIFCMRHPESKCTETLAKHVGVDVCISVITYAELEYGIENSQFPERNREAVNKMLAGIKILDFDLSAGTQLGRILAELRKKGKSKDNQDRDKMIAAHARAKEYILVTDNTKDFEDIDNLQLCNWREEGDLKKS